MSGWSEEYEGAGGTGELGDGGIGEQGVLLDDLDCFSLITSLDRLRLNDLLPGLSVVFLTSVEVSLSQNFSNIWLRLGFTTAVTLISVSSSTDELLHSTLESGRRSSNPTFLC